MTKEVIAKADYMLLYIRINTIIDSINTRTNQPERLYKFEHIQSRFAPADHIWSQDKNSVTNSYREIEQDQFYMIFAHRIQSLTEKRGKKEFGRWVWRYALPLTEKQARTAYAFYVKNSDNAQLCGKFADNLVNPQIAPVLEGFNYE